MDMREARRQRIITEICVERLDHPEAWTVSLYYQEGVHLGERSSFHVFDTEAEADSFAKSYQIGVPLIEEPNISLIDELWNAGFFSSLANGLGEEEEYLLYTAERVLKSAKIRNKDNTSEEVLIFIGEKDCEKLKVEFGEHWQVAAELKYCQKILPSSSPAYVAALSRYEYFIRRRYLKAGHLIKDLENLLTDVEAAAIKSQQLVKAAKRGGEARANATKAGRQAVLAEIGRLVSEGKKPSQAAEIVARRGIGTSGQANRQVWYRHKSAT